MQSTRTITVPFILFELFQLELCPSQKMYPLYNLKIVQDIFTKLSMNINQHYMMRTAQEP